MFVCFHRSNTFSRIFVDFLHKGKEYRIIQYSLQKRSTCRLPDRFLLSKIVSAMPCDYLEQRKIGRMVRIMSYCLVGICFEF